MSEGKKQTTAALLQKAIGRIADLEDSRDKWKARAEKAEAELAKHQWQPIETAPPSEHVILVWRGPVDDFECAVVGWHEGKHSWCSLQTGDPADWATHWMPLPEPPKEKEKCAS